MPIIIDDTTISLAEKVVTAIGTAGTIGVGYLVKKGYVDIWLTKLLVPSEVIHAVKRQNGNALDKLNMSDEIVNYLRRLAPAEDGTIDEAKAIECLHDCIKWNNRIIPKVNRDEVRK